MLIEAKAEVDATGADHMTALMSAARFGHLAVVDALINAKASVNKFTLSGMTALSHACTRLESASVVARLLKAGADPNFSDTDVSLDRNLCRNHDVDRAPLVAAIMARNLETAALLLDAKADANHKITTGDSVLALAGMTGCAPMVKLLLLAGADLDCKDKNGYGLLHVLSSRTSKITDHIAKRGNYSFNVRATATPSAEDRKEVVAALVAAGADIEARSADDGCTPIFWACLTEGTDCLLALLASGADPNALDDNKHSCMRNSVQRNDLDQVMLLIEADADVNQVSDDMTLLDIAAKHGFTEMRYLLLSAGALVWEMALREKYPLMVAATNRKRTPLEEFEALAADACSDALNAALVCSVGCGRREEVQLLLRYGANPSCHLNGRVPLFIGVLEGRTEIVADLVAAKADVGLRTAAGMTALQAAARAKHRDIVEILLNRANELKKERANAASE
jgi:ankyrin repeat protein